jgi:hypothetical protein
MLTTTERPLTPAEVRFLADRIKRARQESWMLLIRNGLASLLAGGFFGLLASASRSSWVAVALWPLLALLVSVLISLPKYQATQEYIAPLNGALRANRANTTRVQSSRAVEFEPNGDEGACYAFEVDTSTCLFVVGPEFHQDDFPNSDFSIVDLLGTRGRPVHSILETSGSKLIPERVVPANVKRLVEIPEHLTTVDAAIDDVENRLGKPKGRGYA